MDSHFKILSSAVSCYSDYVVIFNDKKELVYSNRAFLNQLPMSNSKLSIADLYDKSDYVSPDISSFVDSVDIALTNLFHGNSGDELYIGRNEKEYIAHCHVFFLENERFFVCWRIDLSSSFKKHGFSITDPLHDPVTDLFNHKIINSINIESGSFIYVSIEKMNSLCKKEGHAYVKRIKKKVSLLLTDICQDALCIYLNRGIFVAIRSVEKKHLYRDALKLKKRLFSLSKSENYLVDFYVDVKSFTSNTLISLLEKK